MAKGIDMKDFFRKQAGKGNNPFSMVTHIGKNKVKSAALKKRTK